MDRITEASLSFFLLSKWSLINNFHCFQLPSVVLERSQTKMEDVAHAPLITTNPHLVSQNVWLVLLQQILITEPGKCNVVGTAKQSLDQFSPNLNLVIRMFIWDKIFVFYLSYFHVCSCTMWLWTGAQPRRKRKLCPLHFWLLQDNHRIRIVYRLSNRNQHQGSQGTMWLQ